MTGLSSTSELIVDSFAGGGGASLGIEMALGRSPDIAINHDAEALAMHAANHPSTLHLPHNVWKVDPIAATGGRPVGLLWASPDCFPAGTLVLTDNGYRPIEEIAVGDRVLTHSGRWRAVTETSRAIRPLLTLRGYGHPGLAVSPEHPFLARKRAVRWDNDKRRDVPVYEKPEWTPASMLGPGTYRYNYSNGRRAGLENGWYWGTPRRFPEMQIPEIGGRSLPIDERLLWLAGRYLGDGWTRLTDERAELVITCGNHEVMNLRSLLDRWPRSGARALVGELAWHERATTTAYQFTTNHRGLVEWLRAHFGHLAESKGLPAWALGMAIPLRSALLEGYLSADDGHRKANRVECTTVSKALAFGVKSLAISLGYAATVFSGKNSTRIEGREINARPTWRVRWRYPLGRLQIFDEDAIQWTPIRERFDIGTEAEVFNIGVEEDESYVVEGIIVHNCKHHSKAKGGKPVKREIRDLAWVVVRWARQVRPRVIILENVEEFADWGPLDIDGRPCKERKGKTFRAFVGELRRLGYKVDWRELRACDYGAPTIRKRLFLIARRDGRRIVWPEPTHGRPNSPEVLAGERAPWRTAAEIIDWSIPCPSIFLTREEGRAIGVNRPLAPNTMARIAKGVKRYVIDAAEPFIVPVTHAGDARVHGTDEPLRTVTTAQRGEHAVVTPILTSVAHGESGGRRSYLVDEPIGTQVGSNTHAVVAPVLVGCGGRAGQSRPRAAAEPTATITTKADTCVVAPYLVPRYGERRGQEPRTRSLEEPAPTIVPTANGGGLAAVSLIRHFGESVGSAAEEPVGTVTAGGGGKTGVVAAFLAQHNTGKVGRPADDPLSTITHRGTQQSIVASFLTHHYTSNTAGGSGDLRDPKKTVLAGGTHAAEVRAFLVKYYGSDQDPRLDEPLHTATTKHRFGVVSVRGEIYEIADIGMRMLTPRELFRAQGFSDVYEIETGRTPDGAIILSKTAQVRMCGNSVSPVMAKALVGANYVPDERDRRPPARPPAELPLLEAAE